MDILAIKKIKPHMAIYAWEVGRQPDANKPRLAIYTLGVGWQLFGIKAQFIANAAGAVMS
jgi:hypothetical protein